MRLVSVMSPRGPLPTNEDERVTPTGPAPPPGPGADDELRALFAAQYVPMVRLATLLVDRVEIAEEVVQEAFLLLHRRWDEIDAPGAYLRLTVVNRCRDALRRRRVRRREPASPSWSHDAPDEMADAIAALPERMRTAIVLRFYGDLTIDQISDAMGARPGTVKSWIHRALGRLREVIEP